MNGFNAYCEIVKGQSKNSGNNYTAIQFTLPTQAGDFKSPLIFPTTLEMSIIEKALSPIGDLYQGN